MCFFIIAYWQREFDSMMWLWSKQLYLFIRSKKHIHTKTYPQQPQHSWFIGSSSQTVFFFNGFYDPSLVIQRELLFFFKWSCSCCGLFLWFFHMESLLHWLLAFFVFLYIYTDMYIIYTGNSHPNWLHIFQGVITPPTRDCFSRGRHSCRLSALAPRGLWRDERDQSRGASYTVVPPAGWCERWWVEIHE